MSCPWYEYSVIDANGMQHPLVAEGFDPIDGMDTLIRDILVGVFPEIQVPLRSVHFVDCVTPGMEQGNNMIVIYSETIDAKFAGFFADQMKQLVVKMWLLHLWRVTDIAEYERGERGKFEEEMGIKIDLTPVDQYKTKVQILIPLAVTSAGR